ncbi:MAG: GMC family oxidoreductase [Verrucomicrobia bacterium]|nr:GMC family oxidoreductase [Verrucomicrobiota bacterium]
MVTKLKSVDVVVVGLGAVGGVGVLPLTQSGLDVVALEAGDWLSSRDFAPDELRNNFRGWPQTVQKVQSEIPTHRPNSSAAYSPRMALHPMMNAVGGTSLHYWGLSWRLNPWDFKVVSETTRRYGAGRIPNGSTVEDWPFGYEELEPYYEKVEYAIGVSGQAGNLNGRTDPAGSLFEGPRRREYPMPPLRSSEFIAHMTAAAKKLGWNAFPGPAAINSQPYEERAGCMYHGFCNRGGCHVSAKNSTAVTTIPKAQASGRLQVVTRAQATAIEVNDQSGRVVGVSYLRDGQSYFQPASVVLLASYTYENVRLLLLSKSKSFPNGLANNRGQVGKHYFSHFAGSKVTALFPWELNNWYGMPAQGVAVDEWADDNFDHTGLDFIGGGNLWVYSDRRPIDAASMEMFGQAPRWGAKWKAFIKQNADRWNLANIQKTTLPYADNYIDLDPKEKDALGFPVCRITADFKDNERRIGAFMQEKMTRWFKEAGAVAIALGPVGTMGVSTHAYGGTRMGDNKETNVVDRWGFSHEVPNLAVLGASVMGTSGAHNPTLTAQALAWRTAEHLAGHWKSIANS